MMIRKQYAILLCIYLFFQVVPPASGQENSVDDEQLKAFNNVAIPSFIEVDNHKQGDEYRIVLLGNSLSFHGKAPNIGWHLECGMAASELEKDYAHVLFRLIDSVMPDKRIRMRISGISTFERNPAGYNLTALDSMKKFQPDLLIIQIGENVVFEGVTTPELFEEKYVSLIRHFQKDRQPLVVCTTPFFPSLSKNKVINRVASLTNSFLVDLSHLVLLDKENYAKDETNYPGDKSTWKVDGIGIHPGDKGMKNIAEQLFITIHAALHK